eukprot:1123453-Amphidinium_carterae.1
MAAAIMDQKPPQMPAPYAGNRKRSENASVRFVLPGAEGAECALPPVFVETKAENPTPFEYLSHKCGRVPLAGKPWARSAETEWPIFNKHPAPPDLTFAEQVRRMLASRVTECENSVAGGQQSPNSQTRRDIGGRQYPLGWRRAWPFVLQDFTPQAEEKWQHFQGKEANGAACTYRVSALFWSRRADSVTCGKYNPSYASTLTEWGAFPIAHRTTVRVGAECILLGSLIPGRMPQSCAMRHLSC